MENKIESSMGRRETEKLSPAFSDFTFWPDAPILCNLKDSTQKTLSILLYDYEQVVESISQVEKDVGQSKRFTKVEEKTSRLNNQSYLISMKAHKTSAVSSF